MARQLREPAVAGERRELVDRSPRHVHRDEVRPRPGEPCRRHRLDPLRQALLGSHPKYDVVACGLQEACQGPAMERLVVEPAGEEGGDLGVVERPRRQQRAQVDEGMCLDVLHVAERAYRLRRQRVARHVVPRDAGEIEGARPGNVGDEIEPVHHRHVHTTACGWIALAYAAASTISRRQPPSVRMPSCVVPAAARWWSPAWMWRPATWRSPLIT